MMIQFTVLVYLIFLLSPEWILAEDIMCQRRREFQLMEKDNIAANNIIATHMIRFSAECSVQCTKNPRCKSYNYQYNGNEGSKVCELIQVTREDCPGLKLMQKEGYAYYKEINSHPLKLYGSEGNPGRSCLDIEQCQDKDGDYWISTEKTGKLTVFCFMNSTNATTRINLARGKPASQSSNYLHAYAQRAVDGNRDPLFNGGSCTHTTNMNKPWWRVDLEGVYFIRELVITNRGDICCIDRLSNFEIRIGISLVNNGNENPTCGGRYSLKNVTRKKIVCSPSLLGRYVNIVMPANVLNTLSLCEVEVYP